MYLFLLFLIIGITYISTFLFAVISDAKLGRAWTISIGKLEAKFFKVTFFHLGFIIYLIGYILFTVNVGTYFGSSSASRIIVFGTLVFT